MNALRILAATLFFVPAFANAAGVILDAKQLPAATRTSLQQQIAVARQKDPKPFALLQKLRERLPELDAKRRGGLVPVGRAIVAIGKDAVLPSLEMMAFAASAQGDLSPSAWLALQAGLLEALEELRDVRAEPVLIAYLKGVPSQPTLVRAASSALGALQTDSAAMVLVSLLTSDSAEGFKASVAAGMGSCKRIQAAEALATFAATKPEPVVAKAVARALGRQGNHTSWRFSSELRKDESDRVRQIVTNALLDLYLGYDGLVRAEASDALMAVDYPRTIELLDARPELVSQNRTAAIELSERFERNPVR